MASPATAYFGNSRGRSELGIAVKSAQLHHNTIAFGRTTLAGVVIVTNWGIYAGQGSRLLY